MSVIRAFACLTILLSMVWLEVSTEEYTSSEGSHSGKGHISSGLAPADNGFLVPLDHSPHYDGPADYGQRPIPAASTESKVQSNLHVVSSQVIPALQQQVAASENVFSPENFGFIPVPSQGFFSKPSKLVQKQHIRPQLLEVKHYAALSTIPLQYNIQTKHDPDYKIYVEDDKSTNILAALKKNPLVSAYFNPTSTNLEVRHPKKYRTESKIELLDEETQNKPKTYIPGLSSPTRVRRYAGKKRFRRQKKKRHEEEEEDDDDEPHSAYYSSRPKEFDSELYSSPYKKAQNYEYSSPYKKARNEDDDPYGYSYDSGYDHGEYERIKKLSEEQAAEIKQNPENCKEVKKDGSTCMVCKDPKTGGNYESCAYVSEPKSKQYAYSREKSFDSKDQPEDSEKDDESKESQPAKYTKDASSEETPKDESSEAETLPSYKSTYVAPSSAPYTQSSEPQPYDGYKRESDEQSPEKYQAYYVSSSNPNPKPIALTAADDSSEDQSGEKKAYDYQKAIPGFYTDNESKKDVEHVLAEFKKKDRSACKKVDKNGMTCYQCLDKTGLKHEECMFVSESAPKRSRLAYQETKEFTSKPPSLDDVSSEAESQIVTTISPFTETSSYEDTVISSPYGSKLKRKKVKGNAEDTITTATALNPGVISLPLQLQAAAASSLIPTYPPLTAKTNIAKRSYKDENIEKLNNTSSEDAEENAKIQESSNVAPPEEFAGDSSKGAFWAETQPVYSKTLGVTLPEFMLSRSEFEEAFDETVAGA